MLPDSWQHPCRSRFHPCLGPSAPSWWGRGLPPSGPRWSPWFWSVQICFGQGLPGGSAVTRVMAPGTGCKAAMGAAALMGLWSWRRTLCPWVSLARVRAGSPGGPRSGAGLSIQSRGPREGRMAHVLIRVGARRVRWPSVSHQSHQKGSVTSLM